MGVIKDLAALKGLEKPYGLLDLVSIPKATLYTWEKNPRLLSAKHMEQLAEELGLDLQTVFDVVRNAVETTKKGKRK